MRDYHINIFYSQEDEEYIADIPDLKYCSASGTTPEEALREVLEAKALWLEAAQQHVVSEPEVRQGETAVDPGVPLQTLQCVACGTGQCHHRGSQTDERH
mgnify:CR=1 FL=1